MADDVSRPRAIARILADSLVGMCGMTVTIDCASVAEADELFDFLVMGAAEQLEFVPSWNPGHDAER